LLIACWSPKGGSGTTVVSCGLALSLSRTAPTTIADLAGDVPATLGVADPAGPGLSDWVAAGPDVPGDALTRLAVRVADDLSILASGGRPEGRPRPGAGEALAEALGRLEGKVVVDCGLLGSDVTTAVAAAADVSLWVMQPCYLALRRAVAAPLKPSGIILVSQPERALTRREVEEVLGVPVRAEVAFDASVARAVDAGLLSRRMPRSLERSLRAAA
jgi:cellulose biosynthesis protein BcsQ